MGVSLILALCSHGPESSDAEFIESLFKMRKVHSVEPENHPAKQICKASNLPLTLDSILHVSRNVGLVEET